MSSVAHFSLAQYELMVESGAFDGSHHQRVEFIRGEIDPPLLLLYGEPGRSKTHLALAIGWCFVAQLHLVSYYHVGDLLDYLRAGYQIESVLAPGEFHPRFP